MRNCSFLLLRRTVHVIETQHWDNIIFLNKNKIWMRRFESHVTGIYSKQASWITPERRFISFVQAEHFTQTSWESIYYPTIISPIAEAVSVTQTPSLRALDAAASMSCLLLRASARPSVTRDVSAPVSYYLLLMAAPALCLRSCSLCNNKENVVVWQKTAWHPFTADHILW